MENKSNLYKDFFIKLGIFAGFILIIFSILIYASYLSRKSWQKNLKVCVEKVLDEESQNDWIVGNYLPIDNPFTVNAAAYEATNRKNGTSYKAVIIRITTFYGPLSAVFCVDEDENVELMGLVSVHGRIAKNLYENKYSKRFEYWEKRIPQIFK